MSTIHLKKKIIVQHLQDINTNDHPNKKNIYTAVLEIAKEEQIPITKNLRGYWFNLSLISSDGITTIYNLLQSLNYEKEDPLLKPKKDAKKSAIKDIIV